MEKKESYKENYLIMFGHMADDLCQGAIPAILTFMYQENILKSYADIAFLIMAMTIVNAIAQPIAGYLSDKKPRPYIMTIGMLTAAIGLMFLGFVEDMSIMILCVAISGIGVAIFHPSGGKLAHIFAGKRVGKGMSIFSVGGNIGYALGPLYFTAGYTIFGLKATLLLIVPAAIMACIFLSYNRKFKVYSKKDEMKRKRSKIDGNAKDNYFGTFLLLLLVFARSAAMFSLIAFLPLYFIKNLGLQDSLSTLTVTVVSLCGAVATLFGGPLADKFGFTQLVRVTSFITVPFGILFLITNNIYVAVIFLILLSLFYYAAMSPIVVIGQKLLPLHVGMATGITIGLGISFGGLIAPLIGKVGDTHGLFASMELVIGLIVLSALISLIVPIVNRPKKEQ